MKSRQYPILDDHFHLDPNGKKWKAVAEFCRSGGTHIILVSKPYFPYPYKSLDVYEKIYNTTIKLAKEAMEKVKVKIFVVVGPHPADFTENLKKGMDFDKAYNLMLKAIDLAAKYVEMEYAIAIGEVGRPHYPVSQRVWRASNSILQYAMEKAKDVGCPVVLHTESANPNTFRELAKMADRAGIDKYKVVKHFSPPLILERENYGLTPSVISTDNALKSAIQKGNRFLMETDYIDVPKRPGSVLGPRTVPRKTYKLLNDGILTDKDVFIIHKELPEKVYGIEVEIL